MLDVFVTVFLIILFLSLVYVLVISFLINTNPEIEAYPSDSFSSSSTSSFSSLSIPAATLEGFNEMDPVNLDQTTSVRFRENNAIQSCKSLRSSDSNMSSKSQDNMKMILDSHRINEWKPGVKEPLNIIKNRSDHEYCYMYDDHENNMKDIRLYDEAGCSLNNPIFKDTPFIKNVYQTQFQDNTHTIPIQKCVIEIDLSKTSTSNLDAYWSKWGDTECGSVTNPLRVTLKETVLAVEKLEENMKTASDLLDDYNTHIDQANLDFTSCELAKTRNNEMYNELKTNYNVIYNAFIELDDKRKRAEELKIEKIREEKEKNVLQQEKQKTYRETKDNADACDVQFQQCSLEKSVIEESLKIQLEKKGTNEEIRDARQEDKNEIEGKHNALIAPVSVCESSLQSEKDRLQQIINDTETTRGLYNTCEVEREYNKNLMEIYEPRYERMNDLATKCLEKKEQLFRDNQACSQQKKTCKYLSDEHKNTVARFRAIRDKLLECEEQTKEYNVVRRELEEENVNHYNELDRKLGQLDQFEKALYKQEVQTSISHSEAVINKFKSDLDTLMNANIENSRCSAKADYVRDLNKIKNRNAELKYRVEALKSQSCYYCDPSVSQCAEKFKNDTILCKR